MQIYSKARPFGADKILFKTHFQSKRASQSHLRRILFNPAAQIVLIGEAWTQLACLKRRLMNWLLLTEFQAGFSRPAVKPGWRNVNSVQLNQRRKCSPCCKKYCDSSLTAPKHLMVRQWCCFGCQGSIGDFASTHALPTASRFESCWTVRDSRCRQFFKVCFRFKVAIVQ